MAKFLELLELEEAVGHRWHRLVGNVSSWPQYPEAAFELAAIRGPLAVFFRGLGGAAGMVIATGTAGTSRHRLSPRLLLGFGEERIEQPRCDRNALYLPARLSVFPESRLNRALYFWLTAFFVHRRKRRKAAAMTPLQRDLRFLGDAREATAAALQANPGLVPLHAELCAALLRLRPLRRLPPPEAEIERRVRAMLAAGFESQAPAPAEEDAALEAMRCPGGYRPFLPVPLWGDAEDVEGGSGEGGSGQEQEDQASGGPGAEARDERVRRAKRRPSDQAERKDSLILNRFEKILTLIESLDINRAVEDDDEEDARKALDDAEEIGLSPLARKPATRLKLELDLAGGPVETAPIAAELTYPEWDCARRLYHPAHCRVVTSRAPEGDGAWQPDPATRRRIRQVRRQFEALRPRPEILRSQLDGPDIDIEALVRARTDLAASGYGSDRVHLAKRRVGRDLSTALLVDVSLSTDSWVANRRVLDVEKEALLVLAHALSACGDDHAILTFTSRKRHWVRIEVVKGFDEPSDGGVARRIAALKPGYYTRVGTAIRHATAQLEQRPSRHRLLLLLTDGKPNDIDHYEGRYGIEDTRRAVQEARRIGIRVFGVTIDREAKDYFPALFGRGGYAIIGDVARLPAALPALYKHLAGP